MKNFTISIAIILAFSIIISTIHACPTCVGRLEDNVPPFFSTEFDEHYQATSNDQTQHEGEDDEKPKTGSNQ